MKQIHIQEIDLRTGVVRVEKYRMHGRLHRDGGPALVERRARSGSIIKECYFWKGRLHREGGPALIQYNSLGAVIEEIFYRNGRIYREPKEGPAVISRDDDGRIVRYEEYRPPRTKRDGPYQIARNSSGTIESRKYFDPDKAGAPSRSLRTSSYGQTDLEASPR